MEWKRPNYVESFIAAAASSGLLLVAADMHADMAVVRDNVGVCLGIGGPPHTQLEHACSSYGMIWFESTSRVGCETVAALHRLQNSVGVTTPMDRNLSFSSEAQPDQYAEALNVLKYTCYDRSR